MAIKKKIQKKLQIDINIDWKESFKSHPHVIIYTQIPIVYRIACKCMSDDGGILTIVPSINFNIDDMLNVLEGCLQRDSNFRTVLQDYYGNRAQKLTQIKCNFNGIEVVINDQRTAWETKLKWLRDGLNAGYKNIAIHLTTEERTALEHDNVMKELIHRYRKELL